MGKAELEDPRRYDRSVEAAGDDSLSVIARRIPRGAIVLDLGAATGALGRYLSEAKACTVDGVERDPESARAARRWYRDLRELDLETATLAEHFPAAAYDVIVCADVLEHLREPGRVLDQIPALLRPTGRLILSIPNVGYAGVVAGLLRGEFQYRPIGLLDETHLRFFTRRSLFGLLARHGFRAYDIEPITVSLEQSEFRQHGLDTLPPAILGAVLAQPDALTYQFIIDARPGPSIVPDAVAAAPEAPVLRFVCQLFWTLDGREFDEQSSVTTTGGIGDEHQTIALDIPALARPPVRLRLDIADRPGFLHLHAMRLIGSAGDLLWEWDGSTEAIVGTAHQLAYFDAPTGSCWLALGDDPHFDVPVSDAALARLPDGGTLTVTMSWPRSADFELARRVLDQHERRWSIERDLLTQHLERLEAADRERAATLTSVGTGVGRLEHALSAAHRDVQALRGELSKVTRQLDETAQREHALTHVVHGLSARLGVLESAPTLSRVGRNVRRAIRRRQFTFEPRPGKEVVKAAAGGDEWDSTGADPNFDLEPEGPDRELYPTGWVLVDFEIETDVSATSPPLLYIDRGEGYTGTNCIRLPWPKDGRVCTVVNLLAVVRRLRLDPLDRPGRFRLGRLTMREVGRPELALTLVAPRVRALWRDPRGTALATAGLFRTLRTGGLQEVKNRLVGKRDDDDAVRYADWVERYSTIRDGDRVAIAERVARIQRRPVLSIIMPVYNTPRRWLERAIDSVRDQLYPHWELCVGEDASPAPHVREVLDAYAARDARIKVVYRERNGHISEASNSALGVADGEFVVLMDSDDELPAHALYMVAEELNAHPETDLIYSDEDKIDELGRRYSPYFKPDWNPDLFFSQNYFSHLGVYRTALVREVGGFRKEYDGSQDYDLALRCVARAGHDRVRHIPHVLYHWRAIEGSGATDAHAKSYAQPAAERALRDHFAGVDPRIEVSVARFPTTYRVRYPLPPEPPLVSILIPTRDGRVILERCVNSIREKTRYPSFELIIIDNQSRDPETLEYLAMLSKEGLARVIAYDHPFNYSAMNNAAARAGSGTVLALLNNDVEVIEENWLTELVSQALRPEIGVVGAKLLYPNDLVQHAGIVTGLLTLAGHIHRYLPRDAAGYFCRAAMVHDVSAVTGACLVVRRDIYEEMGGLDEELTIAFNDVDFCLRVDAAGYRNLWTPYAELYHHESLSRGREDTPEKRFRFEGEIQYMRRRWGKRLDDDRYYSPNLSLANENVDIAWPPRARRPWRDVGGD